MEAEIEMKSYFVSQVKFPSLLTDRSGTLVLCRAYVETAKGNVAGKSLQWKPIYKTTVSFISELGAVHCLLFANKLTP
jgi:hypothetical protein